MKANATTAPDATMVDPTAPGRAMAHGSLADALAHARRLLDASPGLAAEQAAAILEAVPAHPEAELILGAALRRQGDTPGALAVLQALAATQPRAAKVHYELALTLAAMGEDAAAIAALRRTVALAPAFSDAWRGLGDLLTLAGDTAAADSAYAQHIRSAIHDPHLMQAGDALCQGRLDIAERLLKGRLKQHPTDVAAMRMLGEVATRLGRNRDAESLLRGCLELVPGFTAARHNLSIVLYRQSKAMEALPLIQQLAREAPRDPNYRSLLAACLAGVGDFEGAIAGYQGILKDFPGQPRIWMSYGHALRTAGRKADSVAAYQHSIALSPNCGEAYWSLANLKTVAFSADEVAAMSTAVARPELNTDDRMHLHFALGRALENAGDYEASFQHYVQGAQLRRAMHRYSADDTHSSVQRAKDVFNAAFFAHHAGQGEADRAPIFVVGLPRSGSTLIEQILSSHSAVEGTMELPDIAQIARDIGRLHGGGNAYPACLDDMSADDIAGLGASYIERTRHHRRLGRIHFIDKMPNNWIHVGLIHSILPQAKIIDARRHPMAACFSGFKQHFARGQNFSYDLVDIGRYYRDYVDLMTHFDAVLPGHVHRVQYETMVTDTETEVRRLLDYCALPFEPACLRFWETDRAVRTASSEQVRLPIFRDGLDQWRHFAPWLGPLRQALGDICID